MGLEVPEGERVALQRLLDLTEQLTADFSVDVEAVLGPLTAQVLGDSGILLAEVVQSFGWDGQRYTRPVNVQAFICRLKALMYDYLEEKGRGAYSTVYKARNRLTGAIVTLKKLKLEAVDDGVPAQAVREVSLLAELNHPNIVRMQDVLWDNNRLYVVLEYLDVDLRQHIETEPSATMPENVKIYMFQILQGLEHIHANCILHRDLKPQNILVDQNSNTCKIADFGLARTYTPPLRPYTHEVVTLLYRPPEILLGSTIYSTPADIWSAGCVFAELSNGQAIFPGDSEIGQLFRIFSIMGTPDEDIWKGVSSLPDWQPHFPQWRPKDLQQVCPRLDSQGVDLLKRLLEYDPAKRISARKALEHPYFEGMRQYYLPGTPSPSSSRPATGAFSSDADLAASVEGSAASLAMDSSLARQPRGLDAL